MWSICLLLQKRRFGEGWRGQRLAHRLPCSEQKPWVPSSFESLERKRKREMEREKERDGEKEREVREIREERERDVAVKQL